MGLGTGWGGKDRIGWDGTGWGMGSQSRDFGTLLTEIPPCWVRVGMGVGLRKEVQISL